MNKKDLTGRRFGRLVALRPTEERYKSCVVWECRCDCGETAHVPSHFLLKGLSRSCGCLQRENRYRDAAGRRVGKLTAIEPVPGVYYGGEPLWRWKCDCGRIVRKPLGHVGEGASTMCPVCRRELNRQQARHMQEMQDRDPDTGMTSAMLDNMMSGKLTASNSSSVRGVCWHRGVGKWQARIFSHGKQVWAGYFLDLEQARRARDEKLREMYGNKEETET